ncbi:acyl-CoA-binding domain-containing protein 6 isoform X7 [Chroicocephalus ridibundus]|uniref:acyl-CoA-binding domain-containing protein 6 isoform X7 n=1 Tax=Chroicocephalus ridibundus TaxID=1192867 RepID=UPI002FDD8188
MSRSGQRPLRNPRARCAFPAGQPVRAYRGVRGTGAAADLGGRRAAMASPPLVAAGAGSGGEASSGSEETGTAAPPGRDLAALFEQAAERLPALLPAASKEQLLYLYARYKQVKFGTCNTPKPSFFDFEGKQKWEAWKALGDISPHQAMQEYIATVKKLDPSWNPQTAEKRGKESKTAFGGPVVSSLYQEETIREEDKNIFDYCRENNIDYVTKAIRSKKVDVNVTDEEQRRGPWAGCFRPARGMSFWGLGDLGSIENLTLNCGRALLHWACDRGHKELVSVLLQHAADVNSQRTNTAVVSIRYIPDGCCSANVLQHGLEERWKPQLGRSQ